MSVAKSYQSYEIVSSVFDKGGKPYIKVKTPRGIIKEVRWYPEKVIPNHKIMFGFDKTGYIYIYKGNYVKHSEWLHATPQCRQHNIFGWYSLPEEGYPENIPEDVQIYRLFWSDIEGEPNRIDNEKAAAARAEIEKMSSPKQQLKRQPRIFI